MAEQSRSSQTSAAIVELRPGADRQARALRRGGTAEDARDPFAMAALLAAQAEQEP
ncbi:MAG: hypothetical protein ACFB22_04460 [Rhodothalassiaceae bacterium]